MSDGYQAHEPDLPAWRCGKCDGGNFPEHSRRCPKDDRTAVIGPDGKTTMVRESNLEEDPLTLAQRAVIRDQLEDDTEAPLGLVIHGDGEALRALFDRLLADDEVTIQNNQHGMAPVSIAVSTYGCEPGFTTADLYHELKVDPLDPAAVADAYMEQTRSESPYDATSHTPTVRAYDMFGVTRYEVTCSCSSGFRAGGFDTTDDALTTFVRSHALRAVVAERDALGADLNGLASDHQRLLNERDALLDLVAELEDAWVDTADPDPCIDQEVGGCDPEDPCGPCGRHSRGWENLRHRFEKAARVLTEAGKR